MIKKIKALIKLFKKLNPKTLLHYESDLYEGQAVALLTQHQKEHVIAPILDAAIGCKVQRVEGYDTDLLGTFTRDIPRAGTQIEAARKKAFIGMKLAKLPIGIASEGAFGSDPITGLFSWNVEYLIWIDKKSDLEVVAMAQGKTNLAHILTNNFEELEEFTKKVGFPEHYLSVRPEHENHPNIRKGVANFHELKEAFTWALKKAKNGSVFVETDMRAHANPTRMNVIKLAAEELSKKLSSRCPECNAPGYWVVEYLTGLPCSACNNPTHEIRAKLYACSQCSHKETLENEEKKYAEPAHCELCNP